jgi:hypothetical protein
MHQIRPNRDGILPWIIIKLSLLGLQEENCLFSASSAFAFKGLSVFGPLCSQSFLISYVALMIFLWINPVEKFDFFK